MEGIFSSTSIPVLSQVVQFAQTRHHILAGNIANLDTPGYRVRDLSPERFHARLKEAIHRRDEKTGSAPLSNSRALRGDPFKDVSDSMKSILYHDDSNVGIEQQIKEIAKNQATHNMAIAIMASQFQLLKVAISERA